ncbi:hypothetical protein BJH93_10570 [Kocuria polaris]|nr:hypothetical protein [Kocuria polaris]
MPGISRWVSIPSLFSLLSFRIVRLKIECADSFVVLRFHHDFCYDRTDFGLIRRIMDRQKIQIFFDRLRSVTVRDWHTDLIRSRFHSHAMAVKRAQHIATLFKKQVREGD